MLQIVIRMNSVFAIILCSFISRVRRFQQPQAIALSDSNECNRDVTTVAKTAVSVALPKLGAHALAGEENPPPNAYGKQDHKHWPDKYGKEVKRTSLVEFE